MRCDLKSDVAAGRAGRRESESKSKTERERARGWVCVKGALYRTAKPRTCSKTTPSRGMSIWKLRLGLNPFTLLLAVLVGLVLVVSYFYMLSFLLGDASPDQGPGARRRLLEGESARWR